MSAVRAAGRAFIDAAPSVESFARRALCLPGEAPDPTGFAMTFNERGAFGFERVGDEERQRAWRAWHAEGLRGHVASEMGRGVHRLGYALSYRDLADVAARLTRPVQRRRAWAELASARELRWEAVHYACPGSSAELEGRIVLPSGRTLGLTVACVGSVRFWSEDAIRDGRHYVPGDMTEHTAMLPCDVLTPALLEVALRAWYVARFHWRQGHWASRERALPRFVIDASWESIGDLPARDRQRLTRAASDAEIQVADLLRADEARRVYATFGVEAVPPALAASLVNGPVHAAREIVNEVIADYFAFEAVGR